MAVLNKHRARKIAVAGGIGVGYGNWPVPGLPENKHIGLTIGTAVRDDVTHPYYLRMSLDEAEAMVISIIQYLHNNGNKDAEMIFAKARNEISKNPFGRQNHG